MLVTPRTSAQTTLLRAVHERPGVTRAVVAHDLGMPSGFTAETVARLVAARLLSEEPAPPTGSRGRPTTLPWGHPGGPPGAGGAITQETWTVAVTELGGGQLTTVTTAHERDQEEVLAAVTAQLAVADRRFGPRVRGA